MTDKSELIKMAAAVIHPRRLGGRLVGDVGAALVTESGSIHTGVCIDTSSGTGFCAEHNAIGDMISAGQSRIHMIVAVWKDEDGTLFVVSPCGRCRELMRQVDEQNLNTEVLLGANESATLGELLPHANSFSKVE